MQRTRPCSAVAFCVLVACFSPDRSVPKATPEEEGHTAHDSMSPVCQERGADCSINGDCCNYDDAPGAGNDLCVNDGRDVTCSAVCTQNADCVSGCCASLEDVDAFGHCGSSSVCAAGWGFEALAQCLAGVDFACNCFASANDPCTPEEHRSFSATCEDPAHPLHTIFRCIEELSGSGCAAAFEACLPDEMRLRELQELRTAHADSSDDPLVPSGILYTRASW